MREYTVVAVDEYQFGRVFHVKAETPYNATVLARHEHYANNDFRLAAALTIAAVFEGHNENVLLKR